MFRITAGHHNKFSLSGSLWALHRQASNSLRGDFFTKHESKPDAVGSLISKTTRSLQNSIKIKKKKAVIQMEEQNSSSISDEGFSSVGEMLRLHNSSLRKKPVCESHSLPTLKLSRMALTYCGSKLSKDDKGASSLHGPMEDDCLETPADPADNLSPPDGVNVALLLPDLIPKCEAPVNSSQLDQTPLAGAAAMSPFYSISPEKGGGGGVVNLGFDGHEESSDFLVTTSSLNEPASSSPNNFVQSVIPEHEDSTPQIHGMSLGYASSLKFDVTGFDVPSAAATGTSNTIPNDTPHPVDWQSLLDSDDMCSTASGDSCGVSTAPPTAQCSPSALRIRVMDGKPNNNNSHHRLHNLTVGNMASVPPNTQADTEPKALVQRADSLCVGEEAGSGASPLQGESADAAVKDAPLPIEEVIFIATFMDKL